VLELLTWTATGLGAGWFVRTVMRSRRDWGVAGDLLTGWLGGLLGGWLFRRLDVVAPDNATGHVIVALAGAAALLVGARLLRQLTFVAQAASVAVSGGAANGKLEDHIGRLGALERRIITSLLTRQQWSSDPNQAFDAQASFGERVADQVARLGGSWSFIGVFAIIIVGWMALNGELARPFDPYPYILLNLALSCLAALQAPVIMMSQNRQAAKDRSDAQHDYEVNVRAEMEIVGLHTKLDLLREQEWLRLIGMVEEQQRTMAALREQLDALRNR
jgi:uncharacterized membrane protein/uncharacterized membrane protein YeaQ/YmgE (transglycosylase-associated protein family)